MLKVSRNNLIMILVLLGLAIVVFVDGEVRRISGGSIQIQGLPIENVSVRGEWFPELFWASKSWSVEINSDKPLLLLLDDKQFLVPAGSNLLFSNHDYTNTGKYGAQEYWGYPSVVEVRMLQNTEE